MKLRENLIGDLWGGFAAALVVIPSALAFGVATFAALGPQFAGQGALAGLIAGIVAGFVAAPLGGAPRLITTPCAPAAAVMGALSADLVSRGAAPERVLLILALVALLCGVLQFIYGAIGAGRLIKYIPFPVVSGYLSGVGLIIFVNQMPGLCGVPSAHGLDAVLAAIGQWRVEAMIVGIAAIAMTIVGPTLTTAVPAAVLGLFGGLFMYFGLGFYDHRLLELIDNRLLIGPLPNLSGFTPNLFEHWKAASEIDAEDLKLILSSATTLSVLLSIDTLKTCVVGDVMTRSRHDSNKELRAQGTANIATTLAGGVPVSGALGATLVNLTSGARTRLSGFITAVFILAALLIFGKLTAWTPLAALSGILLVIAFRMIDWRAFRLLRHRSTILDFFVILAVVIVAEEVGLVAASGAGLALAILLFIRDQIRGSVIRRKHYGNGFFSCKNRLPAQREALERLGADHLICQLQGNLFFGTADQLFTELESDLQKCHVIILDLRRVQGVDFTAAHVFEQIAAILADVGGTLVFAHLPASLPTGEDLGAYLAEVGLSPQTKGIKLFETLGEALEWSEDALLAKQGLLVQPDEPPLQIGEIDLLREFDASLLTSFKTCLEEKSFPAGETIFRRDDEGDELFLIRRGEVRIELPLKSGKRHHLAEFGRGDFFGEISFLDRGQRTADAIALTVTDLYVLRRRRFDELSRKDPPLGAAVFARLAKAIALRLRAADRDLRRLQDA